LEHLLRTYGPWDAEDAVLLSYFTSGEASVRWDELSLPGGTDEQEDVDVLRRQLAALEGSVANIEGFAGQEERGDDGDAAEMQVGLLVMLSGAVDLAHFRQWWRCWGHPSHTALRFMFHIDAGVPSGVREALLATLGQQQSHAGNAPRGRRDPRVAVVPPRFTIAGAWGGVPLVYIQLIGTDLLLAAFPGVAHVLNLSLHDVLVMPVRELQRQLRAAAVDVALEGKPDPPPPAPSLTPAPPPVQAAAGRLRGFGRPAAAGAPLAPYRLQHYVDARSRLRLDLPPTPPGVAAALWTPRLSGLTVEVGHSQWLVLSRAAAAAIVREPALVELLFSLKHTAIPDERFVGSAAALLVAQHGMRWRWSPPLRYVAWNEPRFGLTGRDMDAILANATAHRPYTARKAYIDRAGGGAPGSGSTGGSGGSLWRRAWSESQPACLDPDAV